MLRGLGRTQGTTKTQIVLSALRSVFEENFLEKKSILLPEDQYQALVELVGSPLTPQEIEGRKKLKNPPHWVWWGVLPRRRICIKQSLPGGRFLSRLAKLSADGFFPIFWRSWRNVRVIDILVSDAFDSLEFFRSPGFGIRKLEMYGCHRLDFQSAFKAITVRNCLAKWKFSA